MATNMRASCATTRHVLIVLLALTATAVGNVHVASFVLSPQKCGQTTTAAGGVCVPSCNDNGRAQSSTLFAVYANKADDAALAPPKDDSFGLIGTVRELLVAPGVPEDAQRYDRIARKTGGIWRTNTFGMLPRTAVAAPDGTKWMTEQEAAGNIIADQSSSVNLVGRKALSNLGGQLRAHAPIRKIFSDALSAKAIAELTPFVEASLDKCVARFEEFAASGQEVAMFEEISRFTLEVIARSFLGEYATDEVLNGVRRIFPAFDQGLLSVPLRFPWPLNTISIFSYGTAMDARDELKVFIAGIVERRRADLAPENEGGDKRSAGVLDALLTLQEQQIERGGARDGEMVLDDNFVFDNVILGFFAGYDTTSVLLTRLLQVLKSPDGGTVADRLFEEIVAVPTTSDTQELDGSLDEAEAKSTSRGAKRRRGIFGDFPLLDAVVLETFRIHPAVSGVPRKTTKSTVYKDYSIPVGEPMALNFVNAFRAESLYPEPKRFCPFRFLHGDKSKNNDDDDDEDEDAIASGEQPRPAMWGFGRHMCPGRELAKLEVLLFLKMLLSNFDYELVRGQSLKGVLPFNAPKDRLRVVLEKKRATA